LRTRRGPQAGRQRLRIKGSCVSRKDPNEKPPRAKRREILRVPDRGHRAEEVRREDLDSHEFVQLDSLHAAEQHREGTTRKSVTSFVRIAERPAVTAIMAKANPASNGRAR